MSKSHEEHRIQSECVKAFKIGWPGFADLLFAIPNGGQRPTMANAKGKTFSPEGVRLKAEGARAGAPDLQLAVARNGFHGLFVEIKTPKGRQSPEQKAFQSALEGQGYLYEVARSLDEFMAIMGAYLGEGRLSGFGAGPGAKAKAGNGWKGAAF